MRFVPRVRRAALQIYSNDPARNPVSVALSGKTARGSGQKTSGD